MEPIDSWKAQYRRPATLIVYGGSNGHQRGGRQ